MLDVKTYILVSRFLGLESNWLDFWSSCRIIQFISQIYIIQIRCLIRTLKWSFKICFWTYCRKVLPRFMSFCFNYNFPIIDILVAVSIKLLLLQLDWCFETYAEVVLCLFRINLHLLIHPFISIYVCHVFIFRLYF